jgi:phage-related minor tail protein
MAQVIGFQIQIDGLGKTVETATELKRAIADVNAELKKTTDVQEIKKLEAKLVDLKAAQMEVNKVVKEQIKSRNEEITATDKANGAYRKLSKELNDQRNRYKDLAAAEQESSQEAKDLLVSINNLDKKLKGIDATVGQFQRNVGGYTEALGQFFPKLGGTIGNVTGAIGDLSMGFANLGKTTGAANIGLGAVGLALTAFNAISGIIGDLNQAAKEINDLKLALENFGVASENLDLVSSRAKTIGEVFKTNADDIAAAANTLKNEFGVSFEEAFDAIEKGFLKGADSQGNFLQQLKEYPAQFAAANLSIEEFLAVSIDAANKGVFDDKALDAIKEFGISVKEQLSGTRDAFIGAFGEEFTNQLFNNLNSGAISSGQALKIVTDEIKNSGVSGKELQTLISTLFKSAGEDAGDYVLTLGDVVSNTDKLFEADTNLQKQVKENLKVTQANNLATAKYSESVAEAEIRRKEFTDGLSKLGKVLFDVVIFFVQPLLSAFNAVVDGFGKGYDAIKFIADEGSRIISKSFSKNSEKELNATIAANKKKLDAEKKLQDDINKVGGKAFLEKEAKAEKIREAALNKSKADAAALLKTEDGLNQAIADKKKKRGSLVFGTPEFKKVESEIKQLEKELEKFNPSKAGSKGGEKFVKSFTAGSLAELENQRSELQNAFSNAVVGSGTQKELAVKLNAINNQIKSAVEQQNQILADATRGNLLNNLKNAEQLATLPLTTKPPELLKKEVEDIQKVFKEVTKNADDFRDEQRKKEEEDLEERAKRIETYLQTASLVTDFFSTVQQARFKKDADQLNEQIELTEENIATLEAKAEKASGIKKRRLEKEIVQEKALLESRNKEAEALQLKAAKAEKKIAILQSIIQGALAVNRALAVPPGPPFTIGSAITAGVFAGIQTATIIAQPLAEGGIVTGQRVNQKQNIPTRSNGDNVLAYVKRGEVVLNQRQQSLLGGSPTFRRLGIKGFAEGGMVPPINPPIQGLGLQGNMNKFLQVMEAKTDAINNRIDRLQAYVVSEDIARDLAEGNKLKINATL